MAFVHHFVKGTWFLSYAAIPFEPKDPKDKTYFRVVAFQPDGTLVDAPAPAAPWERGSVQIREGADGKNYHVYYSREAARVLNYLHGGEGKKFEGK